MAKELVDLSVLFPEEGARPIEEIFEVMTGSPITFLLKPITSKQLESLKTKYSNQRGKTNNLKLVCAIGKIMIVGWSDFVIHGKKVPYSHANVERLITGIPAMYQWINGKAVDFKSTLDEYEEEAEKN
jgi:hypothetical protein